MHFYSITKIVNICGNLLIRNEIEKDDLKLKKPLLKGLLGWWATGLNYPTF